MSAQTPSTLVAWTNYATNTPGTLTNVLSTDLQGASGISYSGDNYNHSRFTGWSTSSTVETSKYFGFTVTSSYTGSINITDLQYEVTGNCDKYRIAYSKNANFPAGSTATTGELTSGSSFITTPISNVSLATGEKLYIRFYGYAKNVGWDAPWGVKVGSANNYLRLRGNLVAAPALNGTYTIGGIATTSTNYTTIKSAVNDLNTRGVSGPVTFLLTNTTYNEATGESFPIVVNQFAGTSATNMVTFKPATGKNVTIRVNDITVSNNNYQATAVFKFYGADNIVFDGSNTANGTSRNLNIINANTEGARARTVFWVASTAAVNNVFDGATNITIKNCIIRQSTKNQGEQFCVGIYSGNYTESGSLNSHAIDVQPATADNAKLTIRGNDFVNVKQGVYINGNSSTPTTNVVVMQNDLGAETNTETIIQPACFSNVNGFEYTENLINNLYRDNDAGNLISTGIYIIGNTKNGSILKNTMQNITRTTATGTPCFSGIALSSSEANANILVANNFIVNVSSLGTGAPEQNGYGIFLNTGGGYKIYNNTVKLTTNQNEGYAACLYVAEAISSFDIRNNIFANNQSNALMLRRCAILIRKSISDISNTTNFKLDYNNYTSTDKIGYIGTGANNSNDAGYITSLPAWKSTTGKDANTTDIIPVFATALDLHIDPTNTQNNGLEGTATPLNLIVSRDIDGQIRNTTTPDKGADEWGAIVYPAPGSNTGIYCDSSTTYSSTLWPNGTNWSNGLPSSTKDVIFNSDFTHTGGSFDACSIYVLAGAHVTFNGDANAIVQHSVNVATGATLTFDSGSNLQQVENDKNAGTVTIKRKGGFLKRLDYTMWSSPVVDSRTTGFQTIGTFSPFTSVNRFYEFMTEVNQYATIAAPATTKFALGKAYLIRMPNAINGTTNNGYYQGTARYTFEGSFEGTPNNGVIKLPLKYFTGTDKSFNAIGNPYPSPISIRDFISQNIDVIDGTLYFWRKTNDHTQTTYSACNLEAYTANAAPGGTSADGNTAIKDPYTIDADKGVLNTGQGFIVKALTTGKEVVFRNNMRVKNNSSFFFKMGQNTQEDTTASTDAPGRMWINVTNTSGDFTQAVVAYNPATSLDYDNGYDGKALTAGNISLYSLLQSESEPVELIIQSRGNFVATDKVALGFKADVAGNFEIALDHVDGVFAAGQEVYVIDRLTGSTNNITNASYAFTTEIGTFNNRFELVYAKESQLGTDTPVLDAKELVVYRNGKQINIQAPANMKAVTVYDILGKNLFTKGNIATTDFATTDINVAQQVLIVQITMESGQVISKKIMVN